jgi:hypothetical protein
MKMQIMIPTGNRKGNARRTSVTSRIRFHIGKEAKAVIFSFWLRYSWPARLRSDGLT